MQSNIEEEMGVKIIFPSSRKEESISMFLAFITYIRNLYSHLILKNYLNIFTVIEGTSPDSVTRASERIQLIIDEVNCFFILLK